MLVYCECPKCEYNAVLHPRPQPYWCPLCSGDNGRDVVMKERLATAEDKVEGRDVREE